jgi:hypothetical protein
MSSLSELVPPVSVLRSVLTRSYALLQCLPLYHHFSDISLPQDGPSWLIVDNNEVPGGLASTDITPEGFVCCECSFHRNTHH